MVKSKSFFYAEKRNWGQALYGAALWYSIYMVFLVSVVTVMNLIFGGATFEPFNWWVNLFFFFSCGAAVIAFVGVISEKEKVKVYVHND